MKRIATLLLTAAALCVAVSAFATPNPNGANIKTYIFGDCPAPFSTLTVNNSYPGLIEFTDTYICPSANFANLHNWSFSEDGGLTQAVFNNGDAFRFGFDFTLSGGMGEGGLRLSPWWSQNVDGRINVRIANDPNTGEIACFGGYLPFYSFTVTNGLHYTGGIIHMEIIYKPNALDITNPGTLEYVVRYGGATYASGPLNCPAANPLDPPHGTYGIEDDARAGGVFVPFVGANPPGVGPGSTTAVFGDIFFTTLPTASKSSTWGQLKSLYR